MYVSLLYSVTKDRILNAREYKRENSYRGYFGRVGLMHCVASHNPSYHT
jgi:hypothetical protein